MTDVIKRRLLLVVAAFGTCGAVPAAASGAVVSRAVEMTGSGWVAAEDGSGPHVTVGLPCPGEDVGFNPQPDPPGAERLVVRVDGERYELDEVTSGECTIGDAEDRAGGGTHTGAGRASCGEESGFVINWRLTDGGLGGPDTAEVGIRGPAEAAACSNNLHIAGTLSGGELHLRTIQATKSLREDCFGLVPTLKGTEFDDNIVGTPGPDIIQGLNGNDIIRGLGDDDFLCGGLGDDAISGGAGSDDVAGDFISGLEVPGDDRLFGDAGIDRVHGDVVDGGPLALTGGDDEIHGGDGGDFLTGDYLGSTGADDVRAGGDDLLEGDDGDDVLLGDHNGGIGGDDTLYGGDDVLRGGDGADVLRGDELVGQQGSDFVIGGGDRLIGGRGDDWLRGDDFDATDDDATDSMVGGDDSLSGNDGADLLEGDWLDGGPGDDKLRPGRDRLVGDAGADRLHGDALAGGTGDDTAKLARDLLYGGADGDELRGDSTTAVETHLDGGDVLYGEGGADRLFGEWGADRHLCGVGFDFADGGPDGDAQFDCEITVDIP